MRTTLNLDDSVVASLKSLAEQRDVSLGEVASELLKNALSAPKPKASVRNGVRLLPSRKKGSPKPDEALVKRLLEK